MFEIILVTLIFFFTSGISNLIGFGTGTLSIPILIRFIPFDQTLLLVSLMQIFSGLWKMLGFFKYIQWKTTLIFGLPAGIAAIVGSILIFIVPSSNLYQLFGAFLIFYSLILVFVPTFHIKQTALTTVFFGIAYGFIAGIFGMRGPVRTMFLTAYDLPKREYIATSGAISLLADFSRIFVYSVGGVRLEPPLLYGLFIFIPVTMISAYIAHYFVNKISERRLEIIIAVFLAVVGSKLLLIIK